MSSKDLTNLNREQGITDVLKSNYMPYAMSVIISRAIPEIDGFKPAHRKLLYTMYKMGLMKGPRAKSADVVGQTMSLNPHGDIPIYETMVRMTRGNGALINPWIDSKGNFGRVYSRDMQYAAYRYTEARLDASCENLFTGIDKNAVEFVDNYSGTMQEPTLLPVSLPTILVNANQGIAVGMASNICSFNLREVCEATCALVNDAQADLLQYMPAPDFSTGGNIIYDQEQMRAIYETGRGSFEMQGIYTIDRKHSRIEISEIPYNTTVEAIIDDITRQLKKGQFKEINDVRDETDLNGLKLTIDLKRSTDLDKFVQKLLKSTSLASNFTCNFNVLIDNQPQVLGVRQILTAWLSWRRECLRREYTFDLGKLRDRLHLLHGLEEILLDIDRAIRIIRETEKEADVVPNLMAGFSIDQVQAEYVAEIKLRHLNREYLLKRTQDITDLTKQIADLEKLVASDRLLDKTIAKQLQKIAQKYGRERKTQLVEAHHVPEFNAEDFIEDFNVRYYLTHDGYLKKLALTSLRKAGDLKLKDGDYFIAELEGANKSELLFFTDQGNVYKQRGYEFADQKPSDLGAFLANELDLAPDENVIGLHVTDDYSGYLVMAFANGYITKFAVEHYKTITKRKRITNAFYNKEPMVGMFWQADIKQGPDLLIDLDATASRAAKAKRRILLEGDLIELVAGRATRGQKVVKLPKKYTVVQMKPVALAETGEIIRPELEYYRVRTLPSAGRFLRDEDMSERQQLLGDLV